MMMILRNSSRIVSSRRITPLATKILTTTTTTTTKTTNHFFSSSAPENNNNSNIDRDVDTPPAPVDVIQGPSLLRTPAARPHPSLLFLPGLRSLRKSKLNIFWFVSLFVVKKVSEDCALHK